MDELTTIEDCVNGCDGISYLHDDQEHKTCCKCGAIWNRFDGKLIKKVKHNENDL